MINVEIRDDGGGECISGFSSPLSGCFTE